MAATRRIERRHTVRVLMVDPHDRVLLFEDRDLGLPGPPTFWITPGGGIDPGETPAQAAVREVAEETGYALDPATLRGPLARRDIVHGYSDKIVEQSETFYLARVPAFRVDTGGHTEDERLTMLGNRWWTLAELRTTSATVWPVGLAELVAAVLDGAAGRLRLSTAEESIVPADRPVADESVRRARP